MTGRAWQWGRRMLIGVGVVAVVIAGLVVFGGSGDSEVTDDTAVGPVNTAEVVEIDLIQQVSLDGTLGTVAGDPIVSGAAGVVTSVAASGSMVAQADVLYSVDNQPAVLLYGDTPAYRVLTLGSDTVSVAGSGAGVLTDVVAAGTIIEAGDVLFRVDGEPVVAFYGAAPAYRTLRDLSTNQVGDDVEQLEENLAELGFDVDGALTVDGEFDWYTDQAVEAWQADLGIDVDGVVDLGQVVFIPGASQVIDMAAAIGQSLAPGAPVLTLSTGSPQTGDDVRQLEAALTEMGYDADGDLIVDGVFSIETRDAIVAFQEAVGQEVDGVLNLGDVVFLPGAIRVADQLATAGSQINSGAPILAISSADQVVRVNVPAADQGLIEIEDSVTIVLPGFTEVPGTVTGLSSTATVTQDDDAVFEAIIALDDPTAAGGLDEAPVDVDVAGDSVTGVLAVPVTALVALTEGGYAVEVVTGAGIQLVAVEPGFFATGLVEVTSSGLAVGDLVVLP